MFFLDSETITAIAEQRMELAGNLLRGPVSQRNQPSLVDRAVDRLRQLDDTRPVLRPLAQPLWVKNRVQAVGAIVERDWFYHRSGTAIGG